MREILFRGKRTDNGEWIEGFYSHSGDKTYIIFDNGFAISYFKMKEVLPETVGQFTGLTDKNGKKIFEGDIVEFTDKYRRKGRSDIVFEDFKWKYRWRYYGENPIVWIGIDVSSTKFEVIGNIYDNPDLLEEKK